MITRRPQSYRLPPMPQRSIGRRSQFGPTGWLLRPEVEQLSKLMVIIGLLLYIIGLLCVNGYLLSFGIVDFSLVRARFVYTGALIVAALLISSIPLANYFIKPEIKEQLRNEAEKYSKNPVKYRMAKAVNLLAWWMLAGSLILAPVVLLGLFTDGMSTADVERLTNETSGLSLTEARISTVLVLYLSGWWHGYSDVQ
jgi:hypothetical protein